MINGICKLKGNKIWEYYTHTHTHTHRCYKQEIVIKFNTNFVKNVNKYVIKNKYSLTKEIEFL